MYIFMLALVLKSNEQNLRPQNMQTYITSQQKGHSINNYLIGEQPTSQNKNKVSLTAIDQLLRSVIVCPPFKNNSLLCYYSFLKVSGVHIWVTQTYNI